MKHSNKKKKDNAQQRIKRSRITKPKASDAPRCRSNRLAGVQSDGDYVDDECNGKFSVIVEGTSVNASTSLSTQKEVFHHNQINDGSGLSICQAVELNDLKYVKENATEKAEEFVTRVLRPLPNEKEQRGKESPTYVAMKKWDIQAETASLLANDENCVAKVTHNCIYSIAAHPSTDCLIVGAGEIDGTVGLWNVDGVTSDEDHSASIHMFRVHNAPVCCLHWTQGNSLLSASYDGTVRKLDATTGVFHEMFATYD